jgi:hypothetical protein
MAVNVPAPAPPAVAPPAPDPVRSAVADGIRDGNYNYIEAYERDILGRPRLSQGSSSISRSRSRSYDYTGMDKAHEIGQQAAAGQGALYDAAMKDPMSIPGLTSRIGAMQRYVNAYKSGQDLPDQVVLPARRLASESDSFSRSISRGYTRDKLGGAEKAIRPTDKRGGGAAAEAADQPAQFDDSNSGDGGGGGGIQAQDAGFGPQGPPLPGLGGTDQSPLDRALPDPGSDDLDGRHGIPSLPVGKERLPRDTEGARNLSMVKDPQTVLRRIQEEMGLV